VGRAAPRAGIRRRCPIRGIERLRSKLQPVCRTGQVDQQLDRHRDRNPAPCAVGNGKNRAFGQVDPDNAGKARAIPTSCQALPLPDSPHRLMARGLRGRPPAGQAGHGSCGSRGGSSARWHPRRCWYAIFQCVPRTRIAWYRAYDLPVNVDYARRLWREPKSRRSRETLGGSAKSRVLDDADWVNCRAMICSCRTKLRC
jgi:hypothetical protein